MDYSQYSQLIFNLPPIAGLAPLVLYIILAFNKKVHPVVNVVACTMLAAVMCKFDLTQFGTLIKDGMGSNLGLVPFIVMMATGMSVILRKTGVAELIVHFIMDKVGVNTKKRVILTTSISGVVLTVLLATMAGANSVIAPIMIPVAAAVGVTPSVIGVIFQGASQIGLFLGPISPPAIVVMGLTNMSYPEYALKVGLPMDIVMFIGTYLVSLYVQKKTEGKESYDVNEYSIDNNFKATKKTKQTLWVFLGVLTALTVWGIFKQGGVAFALIIIVLTGIIVGKFYGMSMYDITDSLLEGRRMFWLFITVFMFQPFIGFVQGCGAFDALAALLEPIITSAGKPLFCFLTSFIGIFGINGAHVAQSPIIDALFGSTALTLGVSPALWALCLTVGTQLTSFSYPGLDMLASMGVAQSKDVKWMLVNSYLGVIPGCLLLTVLFSFVM